MNNRPQEYVDRYIEKNYVVRDPVVTELRNTLNPYTWGEARLAVISARPRRRSSTARNSDARDGFVIPMATLSGSVSLFSTCGREPNLSERARAALKIIGVYSQHALKRGAVAGAQREEAPYTPLTPRELEILKRCKGWQDSPGDRRDSVNFPEDRRVPLARHQWTSSAPATRSRPWSLRFSADYSSFDSAHLGEA